MDGFLNKTKELAGLVSALQQQGDDDSDLQNIITQLQAAVAKRADSEQRSSNIVEVEAKIEPVEHGFSLPADDDVTPDRGTVEMAENPKSSLKKKRSSTGKRKATKPASKAKKKRRIPTKVESPSESSEGEDYYNVAHFGKMDDDAVEAAIAAINDGSDDDDDQTLGSLINPWTGLLDDKTYTPAIAKPKREPSTSASKVTSMAFNSTCKLCDVKARLEQDNKEGEPLITDPMMSYSGDNCRIYQTLMSFATHLKSEHVVQLDVTAVDGDDDTDGEKDRGETPGGDGGSSSNIHPASTTLDDLQPDEHNVAEESNTTNPYNIEASTGNQTVDDVKLKQAIAGDNDDVVLPRQQKTAGKNTMYLVCSHCNKRYNLHGTAKSCYDQLVFHMHRKHGETLPSHVTLYSCKECSFQTLRKRDLTRHNYVVHTDHESRGIPCEICGKCVLPTSMVFHMAAVHNAENVPDQVKARTARTPCHICGKEFRGEINLQRHIKCVHSQIKDQLCHLCCQTFFAKRELQLHMFANHKINMSNMKVFRCPAEGCNYETLARRHLFIHSSVHTETKDFTCEHCGKAFKSKPALTQHLRIMHTTDVEYKCPKCTFTSHAKQYVQRHMVIHSDVKRHKCDFDGCSYATHFIENLTKHRKKHRKI